jgi:Xaa-Pro aminopeptidase
MKRIEQAQHYLKEMGLDGWLLYDFHKNNELAHAFLETPSQQMTTRRFFYWIPTVGEPIKIVHAIEAHALDHQPGSKRIYASWQSLSKEIGALLKGKKRVAMEYSPNNMIPYVSKVDGGTIDLIRSFGVEVVSSGDFLPHFTATLSPEQIQSQIRAATALEEIVHQIWKSISKGMTEYDAQQKIMEEFDKRGLVTDHPPIVAVNAHSADPHYAPDATHHSPIRPGDFLLIDLWAKEKGEKAIFGDITRIAIVAGKPTAKQQEVFEVVRKAQKAAIDLVRDRFVKKQRIEGWEVDQAARNCIAAAGYGAYFTHRTGHNIEIALHGSGTHMDNLETRDVRPILPATCFSVEPGIYLPGEFGVRLESDVLIHPDGTVQVTGGLQEKIGNC